MWKVRVFEQANAAVLKLGVATLLRVAKCPKWVAKIDKKKKIGF
jgi:hypothetical protein